MLTDSCRRLLLSCISLTAWTELLQACLQSLTPGSGCFCGVFQRRTRVAAFSAAWTAHKALNHLQVPEAAGVMSQLPKAPGMMSQLPKAAGMMSQLPSPVCHGQERCCAWGLLLSSVTLSQAFIPRESVPSCCSRQGVRAESLTWLLLPWSG